MMKKKIATVVLFAVALLTSSVALALCVTVPEANLRQGPGTQYEKSWVVYKYMPFKKVGQQGSWYKVVDVDGDVHWVYKNLVNDRVRCAVVKTDEANVRTGPGSTFDKSPLSPVEKYYSFKVIGSKGDWVNVEDEDANSGWMAKQLLWMP